MIEAILDTYRTQRDTGEPFIHTLRRVGLDPFKTAANAARHTPTGHAARSEATTA